MKTFLLICSITLLLFACSSSSDSTAPVKDEGDYAFELTKTQLTSYAGGGGIITFGINPNAEFKGDIELSLAAHSSLNATLKNTTLTKTNNITDIVISPDSDIFNKPYQIKLIATHKRMNKEVSFDVNLSANHDFNPTEANEARRSMMLWAEENCENACNLVNADWRGWRLNPDGGVNIEWAFISDDWEAKVMYPDAEEQYRWYKLVLRRRTDLDPVIAAKKLPTGNIEEVAVHDNSTGS